MMSCCSSHSKDQSMWLGLIGFIIGAVVLLERFNIVPEGTLSYLWPTILVVVGLKLMIGSCESCGESCEMPASTTSAKKKRK